MTQREFLNAVLTLENLPQELGEKAEELIATLNEKNSRRSSKPSKVQLENAPIKEDIKNLLAEVGPLIASEIGLRLNISTQKASALCKQLVDTQDLVSTEIKVPKKGKQKQYSVATE